MLQMSTNAEPVEMNSKPYRNHGKWCSMEFAELSLWIISRIPNPETGTLPVPWAHYHLSKYLGHMSHCSKGTIDPSRFTICHRTRGQVCQSNFKPVPELGKNIWYFNAVKFVHKRRFFLLICLKKVLIFKTWMICLRSNIHVLRKTLTQVNSPGRNSGMWFPVCVDFSWWGKSGQKGGGGGSMYMGL